MQTHVENGMGNIEGGMCTNSLVKQLLQKRSLWERDALLSESGLLLFPYQCKHLTERKLSLVYTEVKFGDMISQLNSSLMWYMIEK